MGIYAIGLTIIKRRGMNPFNYKTQAGLIKALERNSQKSMTVSLAWWYNQAEWTLINIWGWKEQDAARFVCGYKPRTAAYHANS